MSERSRVEVAVDVAEWIGAAFFCAVVATAPIWLAFFAAAVFGNDAAAPVFFGALVVVIVLPQAPMRGRPELDGYQRWGLRVGRVVGAPLRLAALRRARRSARALSSSTAASSAAAPSLPARE